MKKIYFIILILACNSDYIYTAHNHNGKKNTLDEYNTLIKEFPVVLQILQSHDTNLDDLISVKQNQDKQEITMVFSGKNGINKKCIKTFVFIVGDDFSIKLKKYTPKTY